MASKGGLASLAEGRRDILAIDPHKLTIKPNWNMRDMNDPANIEHVDMLALSIKEVGVKEPLTVVWEDGKAYVTNGHCRLLGAMRAIEVYKADIKTVPVKSEDRATNEVDHLFSQQLLNSGKPYSQMEQAKLFKRILDMGWQQGDIAKRAGISASRVSQILGYLTHPESVKAMVVAGNVSSSLAAKTVAELGPTAAEKALKQGLETAKQQGSTKVKPSHITGEPRVNLKKLVRDALKESDINDSSDVVIIRMVESDYAAIIDAIDFNAE